jgi:hypothetical protein
MLIEMRPFGEKERKLPSICQQQLENVQRLLASWEFLKGIGKLLGNAQIPAGSH